MQSMIFSLSLLMILASTAWGAESAVSRLLIQVRIDGSDDLHISRKKIAWVHKEWGAPSEVKLNDFKWDLKQSSALIAPANSPWMPKDTELSGAVLHKLRGRGTVKLAMDRDGLIVQFNDTDVGTDEYEVSIDFAHELQKQPDSAAEDQDFEMWLAGRIDGLEEIWLQQDEVKWIHRENAPPSDVVVDGQPWDTIKQPTRTLATRLWPEIWDSQRATLKVRGGREIASLDYLPGQLVICLEDHGGGADDYAVTLTIPRFTKRHLIKINAGVSDGLVGAPLAVYREFEESEGYQVRALLAGQRCFDAKGACYVSVPEGKYQFEVMYRATPFRLVALQTGIIDIDKAQTVALRAERVEPKLRGTDNQQIRLTDLQIRSVWKTGALTWSAADENSKASPSLLISKGQKYHIHAFGHEKGEYVALWSDVTGSEFGKITIDKSKWTTCSFDWAKGTPDAVRKGVRLTFPDGQMEIRDAEKARFSTNRRFFTRSYWLEFPENLKAEFLPQGCLLPATGHHKISLGGTLRPVAAAAILENENLGIPGAKQLWWELTLADSENDLLDVPGSKLNWEPKIFMSDAAPAKISPLLDDDIKTLGNLKDTLTATASFRMRSDQTITAKPELLTRFQTQHFSTLLPRYRTWNTRTYLAKMEREIGLISELLRVELDHQRRMNISWWFNHGAVAGGYSVTMPIAGYVESREWFGHPWAVAHEMLHNFGYGHSHEMNRLDNRIQERVEQFRWFVVDHPEFDPGSLAFDQPILVEEK